MNKLTNAAVGGREKPVNYECTHRCRLPRIYIFWRHADLRLLKRVKIPIGFCSFVVGLRALTASNWTDRINSPSIPICACLLITSWHVICSVQSPLTEPRSVHIHQNYLIDRFEWLLINFPLFGDLSWIWFHLISRRLLSASSPTVSDSYLRRKHFRRRIINHDHVNRAPVALITAAATRERAEVPLSDFGFAPQWAIINNRTTSRSGIRRGTNWFIIIKLLPHLSFQQWTSESRANAFWHSSRWVIN